MRADAAGRAQEGRWASLVLRFGIRVSGAIMAAGLVLASWRPTAVPSGPPDWAWVVHQASAGNGEALALLGVAALVGTPFLRVILMAAAFARGRQWRLLAVAFGVLGLLTVGVFLGVRR